MYTNVYKVTKGGMTKVRILMFIMLVRQAGLK